MAKVEGLDEAMDAFDALIRKAAEGGNASVVTGYNASYAWHVHEDLEAFHRTGEAKFLERPVRELGPELGKQIADDVRGGLTVEQALYRAGLRLQRESQLIVPVDTGNLRGSAFTEIEHG